MSSSIHINCTCGYNKSIISLKAKYLRNYSSDIKSSNSQPLKQILDQISENYDFDYEDSFMFFAHRVCKELLISDIEHVFKMLREYVKYVALVILNQNHEKTENNHLILLPPAKIFCVWRFHILYSSKYIEFCEKINNGKRIHLDLNKFFSLNILKTEENMNNFRKSYQNCKEIYRFYYGDENIDFWPNFDKNTLEYAFRFCLFPDYYKKINDHFKIESEQPLLNILNKYKNNENLNEFREEIMKLLNKISETFTGTTTETIEETINNKKNYQENIDLNEIATTNLNEFFQGNITMISEIKSNGNLWEKYKICSTFQFPTNFVNILVHETLLSLEIVQKLVLDYRRFLFLRCYYPKLTFTPSEEVDIVWHLHLNFTFEYMQTMKILLGYEYLHNPTKGGHKEQEKHNNLYENTLGFYNKLFGNQSKFNWPDIKERFSANPHWFFLTEKYSENNRLQPKIQSKNQENIGFFRILASQSWKTKLLMVLFLIFCMVMGGFVGYQIDNHFIRTRKSRNKPQNEFYNSDSL